MTRRGAVTRWIVLAVLLVAVGAAAFAIFRRSRAPELSRTLVERVEAGTFQREVSGTGTVEAALERSLSFGAAGTVADILVAEGDEVAAGAMLATLDTAALERDLASSRANLASAQADLERLDAQQQIDLIDVDSSVATARDTVTNLEESLNAARSTLATTERLFATGAASQDELTRAREAASGAERQLASARLGLQSAQTRRDSFGGLAAAQRSSSAAQIAQLETAIANLEETLQEATLFAPFAGTVAEIGFEVGEQISPANTLRLVDTSSLFVSARFDENRAAELRAGQSATVVPDAASTESLAARVRRVGAVANRTNNSAQLEADLEFTDEAQGGATVRPGYTVTARVTVNAVEDALLIPLEAITETDGEAFVYKVSESEPGEGSAERVTLQVLDRNATVAAATSDNLAAGDLIALINLDELEPGAAVGYDPLDGAEE